MDAEGRGMRPPIPIFRGNEEGEIMDEETPTAKELLEWQEIRGRNRSRLIVGLTFSLLVLGFASPLVIFLIRLSLGAL